MNMKINKSKVIGVLLTATVLSLLTATAYAASSDFLAKATEYYQRNCTGNLDRISRSTAILCYLSDKISELDAEIDIVEQEQTNQANLLNNVQSNVAINSTDITILKGRKSIIDIAQVRGANWETGASDTNVETPDHVTVNCPEGCILWVNYDVDTRNPNGSIAQSSWPQHLYHIYVDGVDQAVFNQASMIVANAAIPLAVNGVFPVAAGEHTVTIYARTTGGTLQQFESHLQVLASTNKNHNYRKTLLYGEGI